MRLSSIRDNCVPFFILSSPLTLNAIVALLNQPEVSTLKTGSTNSLLFDQENALLSFERREENKAHTQCPLGSYCVN